MSISLPASVHVIILVISKKIVKRGQFSIKKPACCLQNLWNKAGDSGNDQLAILN